MRHECLICEQPLEDGELVELVEDGAPGNDLASVHATCEQIHQISSCGTAMRRFMDRILYHAMRSGSELIVWNGKPGILDIYIQNGWVN